MLKISYDNVNPPAADGGYNIIELLKNINLKRKGHKGPTCTTKT